MKDLLSRTITITEAQLDTILLALSQSGASNTLEGKTLLDNLRFVHDRWTDLPIPMSHPPIARLIQTAKAALITWDSNRPFNEQCLVFGELKLAIEKAEES